MTLLTSSADLILSIASLPDQTNLLLIIAPLPNKTTVKATKPSESSVAVSVAVRWVAVFFFADLSSCFIFILVSLCPYIPDATPSLVSSLAPSRGPRGTFHREYRRRSHGESCGALGMALLCTPSLGSVGTSPGVPSNIWWALCSFVRKESKSVPPVQELYGSEFLARHGSLHMAPKAFLWKHKFSKGNPLHLHWMLDWDIMAVFLGINFTVFVVAVPENLVLQWCLDYYVGVRKIVIKN